MSVKTKREARNWSPNDLAQKSGVSQASIWRIEHGQQKMMLCTAISLARALNCSVEDLYEPDTDEAERPGA